MSETITTRNKITSRKTASLKRAFRLLFRDSPAPTKKIKPRRRLEIINFPSSLYENLNPFGFAVPTGSVQIINFSGCQPKGSDLSGFSIQDKPDELTVFLPFPLKPAVGITLHWPPGCLSAAGQDEGLKGSRFQPERGIPRIFNGILDLNHVCRFIPLPTKLLQIFPKRRGDVSHFEDFDPIQIDFQGGKMDLFEGMNVVQELKGAEPVDLRDLSGTNQRLARVNFFFLAELGSVPAFERLFWKHLRLPGFYLRTAEKCRDQDSGEGQDPSFLHPIISRRGS
ncbi:MAG: hypothetical protein C0P67_010250 [Bacillota bacterium]